MLERDHVSKVINSYANITLKTAKGTIAKLNYRIRMRYPIGERVKWTTEKIENKFADDDEETYVIPGKRKL